MNPIKQPGPTPLEAQIIQEALANVGVHEDPKNPNWGPAVKIYLAFVGLFTANPWCMAFVCYRIYAAAKAENLKTDWLKTGSCTALWKWASKTNRILDKPRPGCVFLLKSQDGSKCIHTGIVSKVIDYETLQTVEGNSNDDGSAEGYEVAKRIRIITSRLVFVRVEKEV